jgi:hypothetical protein
MARTRVQKLTSYAEATTGKTKRKNTSREGSSVSGSGFVSQSGCAESNGIATLAPGVMMLQ